MVQYRRARTPGGVYFFTVTLRDRRSSVLTDHIDLLRKAVRRAGEQRPFDIHAAVVLPEHMHHVWQLPEGDADYSSRWQAIKARFALEVRKAGVGLHKNRRNERDLWQRRYWEHQIRDELDLQRHVDYIHYNPVKHGLVSSPVDWPYSSIHRFIRRGELESDWAVDGAGEGEYGE